MHQGKGLHFESKWADSGRLQYLQELKCEFEKSKSQGWFTDI